MFKSRLQRVIERLHHCIEGGRVGDDGGDVVGEDCGDDDGHDSVPAPPEEKGRGGPIVFFVLDLLPIWEKGFPSGPWPPWQGKSPSEIGSVSLCFCVLRFYPFTVSYIYMEICNSNWTETFAVIFLPKISFLAAEEGHQLP